MLTHPASHPDTPPPITSRTPLLFLHPYPKTYMSSFLLLHPPPPGFQTGHPQNRHPFLLFPSITTRISAHPPLPGQGLPTVGLFPPVQKRSYKPCAVFAFVLSLVEPPPPSLFLCCRIFVLTKRFTSFQSACCIQYNNYEVCSTFWAITPNI